MPAPTTEITGYYLQRETALSICVCKFKDGRIIREIWLPRARIPYMRKYPRDSKGIEIVFEIENWLAEKENL